MTDKDRLNETQALLDRCAELIDKTRRLIDHHRDDLELFSERLTDLYDEYFMAIGKWSEEDEDHE